MHELPQSNCGDNREGTVFSWLHLYCAHFASARLQVIHDTLCVSWITYDHLMINYDHCIIYIYIMQMCMFMCMCICIIIVIILHIFDRRGKFKSHLWNRPLIAVLEMDVRKTPWKMHFWEVGVHRPLFSKVCKFTKNELLHGCF